MSDTQTFLTTPETPAPADGSTGNTDNTAEPEEVKQDPPKPVVPAEGDGKTVETPADKPPDAKPEDKPKEGETPQAKATDATPDIELKVPEGMSADAEPLKQFKQLAKESGLKGEQAQRLFDFYVQQRADEASRLNTVVETQQGRWLESLKEDKELGGEKLGETQRFATRFLRTFATEPVIALLNETGLGSHPELVRLCAKAGRALAEDSVAGTVGSGTNRDTMSPDERLARAVMPSLFQEQ